MFYCIYTLTSIHISITENIYIKLVYFAALAYETTLAGLINSDYEHIDVDPTRTVLSGFLLGILC